MEHILRVQREGENDRALITQVTMVVCGCVGGYVYAGMFEFGCYSRVSSLVHSRARVSVLVY